jgi:hypothetical protein
MKRTVSILLPRISSRQQADDFGWATCNEMMGMQGAS